MLKALLLSVIFSFVVLPTLAAREKRPTEGYRKAIKYVLAFNAFYFVVLIYLYGRI